MLRLLFALALICHSHAQSARPEWGTRCSDELQALGCNASDAGCSDARNVETVKKCVGPRALWKLWDNSHLTEPEYGSWLFWDSAYNFSATAGALGFDVKEPHARWIVITTIAPPTEAVARWAGLSDWKVVVVGDQKTPTGWELPGVEYLSYDAQLRLGLRTASRVPSGNYARKMLGYLWAMSRGARVIFETDDDNFPRSDMNLSWIAPHVKYNLPVATSDSGYVNPYAYFGEYRIWPRGYPLVELLENGLGHWFSKPTIVPAAIPVPTEIGVQQGIADLDPDVDAIWRLSNPDRIGNVRFQAQPPIALNFGTMSPYNTQNTAHHYDAFWALFIPPFVDMRVCDIWRSYWAQRLLWEQRLQLVFVSSTVEQVRNAHDYVKDFYAEMQLYAEAHVLVGFLVNWECSFSHIFDCMLELAHDMAVHDFWSAQDVEAVADWIHDLVKIGFAPRAPRDAVINDNFEEQGARARVATVLFGQDRATEITFPSLKRNVLDYIPSALYSVISADNAEGNRHLRQQSLLYVAYSEPSLEQFISPVAAEIPDNWLGNAQGRKGSGLRIMYNKMLIRDMIVTNNLTSKYDWFILTRTDYYWLGPHYNFKHMRPCCLIPDVENSGGVNDRHIVCHKNYIIDALSQIDLVRNQSDPFISRLRTSNKRKGLNSEDFLKKYLHHMGIPVVQFPHTAFLTATPSSSTRWSVKTTDPMYGLDYKYGYEYASALENADRLREKPGVRGH